MSDMSTLGGLSARSADRDAWAAQQRALAEMRATAAVIHADLLIAAVGYKATDTVRAIRRMENSSD